jgi:3-hydroxyacyl-CoA dehydrogenase
MDLKRKVFQELEGVVQPGAILASNTSTLPIMAISEGMRHPERAIGMHFFFPASRMPLVEVIPSVRTAPDVTATVVELARRCGKTAIVVKDSPGFLVNRILLPYMIEAYFLLEEGATVAQVDGAAAAFGMPMGPIRLTGEVGVRVAFSAGAVILDAFRERLQRPALLDAMLTAYNVPPQAGGKAENLFMLQGRSKLPNAPAIEALARASGVAARPHTAEEVTDRLFLAMANEAMYCLAEEVVPSPGLLDLSLILGIGFPPFRGGLCRWIDERGAGWAAGRLDALAASSGKRFTASALLRQAAQTGGRISSRGV